jgi:adenine-specific DNA-methyltransferase
VGKYDDLTRERLIDLLEKRDRDKKLGLVWERDEIEADVAVDANFVICEIVSELSEKPAPWRNLVIEGDNYDALRWLRMTMAGRMKAIYIDPPYNTGNKDWVYNDHYVNRDDRYRHSTWLEFLFKRLTLARDLLAEDGVILVSINDEQRAKLELLMEEALPGMRIGSMVWRTRAGGNEGGEHFFTDNHEHVLIYGNAGFRFGGTDKSFEMYRYWDEGRQDWYRLSDMTVGVGYLDPRAGKGYYPIRDPDKDVWYPCNPDAVWRYASRELSGNSARIKTKFVEDWIAAGQIRFPENPRIEVWESRSALMEAMERGDVPSSGRAPLLRKDLPDLDFWVGKKVAFGTPAFKRYKQDLRNATQPLSSWITPRNELDTSSDEFASLVSGTNDEGSKAIKDVFGEKAFNYAKPPSLIRELLRQSTSPGDLILDFFAGSATTAQAVMELNAKDGGYRRFIMVSSTEATPDEPEKNLCRDVTAERIRRLNAADGKYADLAAEFAYLRTREIDFEDLDYDLTPSQAWSALEALHGLPLTAYDPSRGWNGHDGDDTVLVLVDTPDVTLPDWVSARSGKNLFVYAWAPGQVEAMLAGIDVLPVRQTLVSRFIA